jgi:hypothetical protein
MPVCSCVTNGSTNCSPTLSRIVRNCLAVGGFGSSSRTVGGDLESPYTRRLPGSTPLPERLTGIISRDTEKGDSDSDRRPGSKPLPRYQPVSVKGVVAARLLLSPVATRLNCSGANSDSVVGMVTVTLENFPSLLAVVDPISSV